MDSNSPDLIAMVALYTQGILARPILSLTAPGREGTPAELASYLQRKGKDQKATL